MNGACQVRINNRWDVQVLPHRYAWHTARESWEADRLSSCAVRIEPGMTVWDVGAEEGDFTSLYRQWVGDKGRIVAVEPSPGYWPAIRATWEANGYPEVPGWFAGFMSDVTAEPTKKSDDAWSREAGEDGWPKSSTWDISPDYGFRHLAPHADIIPQITICDLAERFGVPDGIILDIEGAEHRALKGGLDLFAEHDVNVWASLHPVPLQEWYHADTAMIHEMMRSVGYRADYLGFESEQFWLYRRG